MHPAQRTSRQDLKSSQETPLKSQRNADILGATQFRQHNFHKPSNPSNSFSLSTSFHPIILIHLHSSSFHIFQPYFPCLPSVGVLPGASRTASHRGTAKRRAAPADGSCAIGSRILRPNPPPWRLGRWQGLVRCVKRAALTEFLGPSHVNIIMICWIM